MKKADLIRLLGNVSAVQVQPIINILDEPVPVISVPTLVPTTEWKPKLHDQDKKSLGNEVRSMLNSYADWLIDYVPPAIKKVVNEKWESLKSTVLGYFVKQKEDVFEVEDPEYWRINYTKHRSMKR